MTNLLEQVINMKNNGFSEEQIISELKNYGIPPKEISNVINQAQIKNVITNPSKLNNPDNAYAPEQQTPQETGQNYSESSFQETPQQLQEPYFQEQQPAQQEQYIPTPNYSYDSQQENNPENYYQQQNYGYEQNQTNSMIEVAEQVFLEKIREIEKKIREIEEFKAITKTILEQNIERLKKIEKTIDKLQIAILEKVGSYGQNIESIKKEMSMMQDSFRKIANTKTKLKK